MFKKLLSMLLVVGLLTACLGGCGTKAPEKETEAAQTTAGKTDAAETEAPAEKEPYEATLIYYVNNEAAPGIDAVEERLNELTQAALNTKVNLKPMSIGTYLQQMELMLSGGEEFDIFPIMPANAANYISSGYVVNLNEYMDTYGANIKEIIGEAALKCCTNNGFQWGIPGMLERAKYNTFVVRADILAEVGFSAEDIKSREDMTEVFAAVAEKYPDMIVFNDAKNKWPNNNSTVDNLGDYLGVLENYGTEAKVVNYFETDTYKDSVELMAEWYKNGYVFKDYATNTDSGETMMKAGNLFCFSSPGKPDTKLQTSAATGYDTEVIILSEPMVTTNSLVTLAYGVSYTSKDPARAVELYDWIVSTKEANDLLNWGVEGVDWVEAEDGTATYPEGVTAETVAYHQDMGWAQPNQMNAHVWTGNLPNIFELYKEDENNAHLSIAAGFTFDSTNVLNEVTACQAVVEQYANSVASGATDVEAGLAEFNEALYKAGLQKIMDEKQSQLDAWLAAN